MPPRRPEWGLHRQAGAQISSVKLGPGLRRGDRLRESQQRHDFWKAQWTALTRKKIIQKWFQQVVKAGTK